MDDCPAKRVKLNTEEDVNEQQIIPGIFGQRISIQILDIQLWLSRQLSTINFSDPVGHVYNPVEYAGVLFCQYVQRFCDTPKTILVLGMNPGPWGMAQTGVPFGEVAVVKDWLRLVGTVSKPQNEHPLRPITGLECHRSEVSGRKLWGLIRKLSGPSVAPEVALSQLFIHNYCPLVFLRSSGCNITPGELKSEDRRQLFGVCDEALKATVAAIRCHIVLGVGKFAETRAACTLRHFAPNVRIHSIPHPSPRNVACRKNWESLTINKITELGLLPYFSPYNPYDETQHRGNGT